MKIDLPEYIYGITMSLAFFVSFVLFLKNISKNQVVIKLPIFAISIAASSIFGSRLLYILLFPQKFSGFYDYLALHRGGFVFYGGFVAAFLSTIIYSLFYKINLLKMLDACAPSVAIGHAIGRIGCLTNGCCYGKISEKIKIYSLKTEPVCVYRHPTQLYESLFLFFLTFLLYKIYSATYLKNKFIKGLTSGVYLIAYSIWRFFIEFLRDDNRGTFFTHLDLSISQMISLFFFLTGFLWMWYAYKNYCSEKQNEKDRTTHNIWRAIGTTIRRCD